jgi:hypothetical protein
MHAFQRNYCCALPYLSKELFNTTHQYKILFPNITHPYLVRIQAQKLNIKTYVQIHMRKNEHDNLQLNKTNTYYFSQSFGVSKTKKKLQRKKNKILSPTIKNLNFFHTPRLYYLHTNVPSMIRLHSY